MLLILYLILSDFEGNFDSLTRFYNRGAYERASKQLKDKKNYAVIIMDVNNFKEVNDTYGHDFGDLVLKDLSQIIKESFDSLCNCYRIGGDEFCIIRKNANETKLVSQLDTMIANLKEKRINNKPIPTIAYGYSLHREKENMDFQMVLIEADENMYLKKQTQKSNNKLNKT
jgi:diguanylate cyclase (GGDEF)-like protein